ncbi:MAG: rhodanese-like domain-containing protein [Gammaproteobacteria bacterium]
MRRALPAEYRVVVTRACGLLLAVLLMACPGAPLQADDFLSPGIAPVDLQQRLASDRAPLVVDLRAPLEYAIAHIPGAINVPVTELEARIGELRNPNGVVIYCLNGSRTRQAEPILYAHDIDNFSRLEGTLQAWLKQNLPYEKGGVQRTGW